MDRKEYERLKEEEKQHLRELKRLRQRLREAERRRSLAQAVGSIEEGAESDEFDEALRSVQEETLESEVRVEMALESAETAEAPPIDPEEERKLRAAALVRQMKVAMGGIEPEDAVRDVEAEPEADGEDTQKTIGKPDPAEPTAEEEEPEKTIGRMVRRSDDTD